MWRMWSSAGQPSISRAPTATQIPAIPTTNVNQVQSANTGVPVLPEMRRAADYEPSRARAHQTNKGQKNAEFLLHVFQLLSESPLLVLKEALALLGVHPVAEEARRLGSHEGVDRNGSDSDRTHQS